jgi:hypothetical protein
MFAYRVELMQVKMTYLFAVSECINILFHVYVFCIIISRYLPGLCIRIEQVDVKYILFSLKYSLYNAKCRDICVRVYKLTLFLSES